MLPPGLAMIGLSQKAVEKIEEKSAGYYFNLATELKNQRKIYNRLGQQQLH